MEKRALSLLLFLSIIFSIAFVNITTYAAVSYSDYTKVNVDSYQSFRNSVLGNYYNTDGDHGAQCWDGANILWLRAIGRGLQTGNGYANGCWNLRRTQNAGTEFELITNISSVQRGDVVVFSEAQPTGHIAFADENYNGSGKLSVLGQNQTNRSKVTSYDSDGGCWEGPFTVSSWNVSSFLGAFRYKGWNNDKITFDTYATPSNNIGAVNFSVWFNNGNALTLSAVGYEISVNNGAFTSYTTAQNVTWTRSILECDLSRYVNTNASDYKVRAFVTVDGETFRSEVYTIYLNTPITFDSYTTPSNNFGEINYSVWFSNANSYTFSSAGYEISVNNGDFNTYITAQDKSWARVNMQCKLSDYVPITLSVCKVRAFVKIGNDTYRSDTYTIYPNTAISFDTYSAPSNNTDEVNCAVWYSNNNAYNISAVGYEIAANGGDFNTYTVYQNVSWTRVLMQCKLSDFVPLTTTDYSVRVFVKIGNDTYRSNTMSVHLNLNDSQAPVITNLRISDIDNDGYTITCNVSDNLAVSRVQFSTWTAKDGQDDLTWHNGIINGNTASCRINISEHGNERDIYYLEAYAWNATGNYSKTNTEIILVSGVLPISKVYNGHYYAAYTFNGDYDWDSANTYCNKLGGHLVTITSAEENNAVLELMLKAGKEFAWVGATDKVEEGNWKWVNGETLSYTNWADYQPDNYNGEQHYSVMRNDGTWDDGALFCGISCFICEYENEPVLNASLENKETYTTIKVQPQFIETGNNIVIAVYKNYKLTDIQIKQYNGEDISTATFAEYDTIKVMILKNMASMIPLAKVVTIYVK